MMQKQVKGTCIVRNHPQYGTIFINLNKFNKQYIRVIKEGTTNNYSIPENYVNNELKLEDIIKILSTIDKSQEESSHFGAYAPNTTKKFTEVKRGKILGKYNDQNIFLNKSDFGYYLKLSNETTTYNIKHYVAIDKLDLEAAINIINDMKNREFKYNNSPVILYPDGKFGAYIKYNDSNINIPKNKSVQNLSQDEINNIIDKYLERKNTPVDSKGYDANNLYVETIKTIIPPAAPPIVSPIVLSKTIGSIGDYPPIDPPASKPSYANVIKNKK